MEEVRVAILDDYIDVARKLVDWDRLPDNVSVEVFHDTLKDEAKLVERLKPFHAIVVTRERTPLPGRVLQQLPNVKLIMTGGMHNRSIDFDYCHANGITVCGSENASAPTMELAWLLILALAKDLKKEEDSMRAGGWQAGLGFEVKDKVLGIVGLGRIGSQMARVAQAFGMKAIAWSENLTADVAKERGAERVSKEELFKQSDFVTLHTVLSDRTRGLVGKAEFELMKPTSFLVNTSRGPIVDEAALLDALQTGKIAGAGLDVFDEEPLPADHPVRKLPNTILTPHIGSFNMENYEVWYRGALEDVEAWLKGEPIRVIKPGEGFQAKATGDLGRDIASR